MTSTAFARLLACALMAAFPACTGAEAHDPPGAGGTGSAPPPSTPRGPRQYVVILDLSGSITPAERDGMGQHVGRIIRALSFGDHVVLLRAATEGIRTAAAPAPLEMPEPAFPDAPDFNDSSSLQAAQRRLEARARTLLATPASRGTDLFASLHQAAGVVQQSPELHSTVVLISDMLQCTRELCIEADSPIPDQRWIAHQKEIGVIPNLNGACIVVIGADATNARGVRIKQFWKSYFAATGASLDDRRYVHDVTAPAAILCPQR